MEITKELEETARLLKSKIDDKIAEIQSSPLDEAQKKQLIEMAENITKSVGNLDIESINKIIKFA